MELKKLYPILLLMVVFALIYGLIISESLIERSRKTCEPKPAQPSDQPIDVFETIYRENFWGPHGGGSGQGSRLENTVVAKMIITDVVRRYNITRMLDAACGGMLWMPDLLQNLTAQIPGFQYMGVDVVHTLVVKHRQTFANHSNWRFLTCDFSACNLPYDYELIFSRDALQHLTMPLIFKFLQNVQESDAKYLLVGSYAENYQNVNLPKNGDCFTINLLAPPFSLPPPLETFRENERAENATGPNCAEYTKSMYLFTVESIRQWEPPSEWRTN